MSWADCATDAPHLGALFDQGFITVADNSDVVISTVLDPAARKQLGVDESSSWRVPVTGDAYLHSHRQRVFKKG